jgi:outer membrane protein OmpA-like peptidoglycan-associated protein
MKPPAPIIRTVYFNNDTTDLTDESKAKIDAIYNDILTYPAAEILVVGHTDTQASAPYNIALSERRAELIRQNLIEIGIDPAIITTEGRGETDLLVPTADNVSEVRNRRVVIDVH